MQPKRRIEVHLHPERGADGDKADDQDDEDDGTIAGIGEAVVQVATGAGGLYRQEPVE
ncbi:hypothetical protein D3C72_2424090 [compost metagenome]